MKEYHYADGLEHITYAEGMIRMDLFQYESRDSEKNVSVSPHEVTDRLIMPPIGFIQAYEAMGKLMDQLEKNGLVTRKSSAPPVQVNNEGLRLPSAPSSPNFS